MINKHNISINGAWWLIKNAQNEVFINKGIKPIKNSEGGFRLDHSNLDKDKLYSGFIHLINSDGSQASTNSDYIYDHKFKDLKVISSKFFKNIEIPDVTYEQSPLEIEITKSGHVYTYD